MNEQDYIDDQTLGAFVDGELDSAHCEQILKALDSDSDLRDRVYRIRRAKDLMQLGFGDAKYPARESFGKRYNRKQLPLRMAASIVALVISFSAGLVAHKYLNATQAGVNPIAHNTEIRPDASKVILHISQSDPAQFATALDYTEQFLREHDTTHQIEVVAHSSGIDLLRADVSPEAERIVSLMQHYDNVHFVGCAGAIRVYTREHGNPPRMIKGVDTDMTAFDHIVDRLQAGGWTYIKVETLPEA